MLPMAQVLIRAGEMHNNIVLAKAGIMAMVKGYYFNFTA
jgi:hypothetical protein